jgi:phosphoserine phosphatase
MFRDSIGNYKLKIAFDFDGTLTDTLLFDLAERLILKGHDVWIMTARIEVDEQYKKSCEKFGILPKRVEERNADIVEMAKKLKIENKIVYTNLANKSAVFKANGFDLLFDDDAEWHCNPICEIGGMAVNV